MNTIVKGIRVRDPKTKELLVIDVDVEIDLYNLAWALGDKAYNNKSGKSHAHGGIITVSVRKGSARKEAA